MMYLIWFAISLLAGWLAGQIGAYWLRSSRSDSSSPARVEEARPAISEWTAAPGRTGPRVQPYVLRQALSFAPRSA